MNSGDLLTLVASAVCAVLTMTALWRARRGKDYPLRELPALRAVDDALGRAAEMGRPILFTTGYGGDIQRPTTIAALGVFANIAERAATYDCTIIFPSSDPLIMAAAQEVGRESYTRAGYPDRFHPDEFTYVGSSQFGYAAAVEGEIGRRRPASIFLLGTFEAEALILAEAGSWTGAMQIAGTDSTIQLSFFLISCDYTLIGEEVFAAAGYLTRNPSTLASIWSQDILKLLVALFLGAALVSAAIAPQAGWWRP